MKNSAFTILSTFSRGELKSFSEFINSPFHNKNNKVIIFFDFLRKYYPDFSHSDLNSEKLFAAMYGNASFRESYIRNLLSDLKILAENFLVHTRVSRKDQKNKILIEELHERDLTVLLNKKIEAFEKETAKRKLKDQEYFLNKLFVYEIKSFVIVDKTLTDSFRKDQILSLINFFFISIMESSFHFAVEEQRVNIRHEYTFLRNILEFVKHNEEKFSQIPLLMIYYHLWLSFLNENADINFRAAKNIFKMNFETLTQTDKKNIYSIMQIYYDNKIRSGDISCNFQLLNLLLEMLKHKVISHNRKNSISLNLYRNILILCFKLKEKVKLKYFITEYLKFVRTESRSTISAYSSAHLNFLENNFEEALVMCQRIDFSKLLTTTNENLYFKIDVRTLMLKCFYELRSFESALSHLQTFRHFLNNSKIIKESSKENLMFIIRAVNEMISLNFNYDEYKMVQLKKRIMTSKDNPGTEWIERKIIEIEKRK